MTMYVIVSEKSAVAKYYRRWEADKALEFLKTKGHNVWLQKWETNYVDV